MEFEKARDLGHMLKSGLRRINEKMVPHEPIPTPEFVSFIDGLSQGILPDGDPYYGVLAGGGMEGMTYGRHPDGSETAYYDVVTPRTNTKLAFPVTRSALGEFEVGKPIIIDLRDSK